MSIKAWPEQERPREKLLARGVEALSDAELLAILLRTGVAGMSAVDLARYLLNEFGSLSGLMNAQLRELSQHKGMGLASYTQFAVVREIGRRVLCEELAAAPVFDQPRAVRDFLRLRLGHERVEVAMALLLNNRHQLIRQVELGRGTVGENTVYVREIARLCLEYHATALILVHNHPGGSAQPSDSDVQFTRRLAQALDLIDVRLVDHFIVTARETVSLAELGCLKDMQG